MASSQNPMAYLLENGLRRVESERPELSNDSRYLELKERLLRDAEGHFREIQATYATILKPKLNCGGKLEPVAHSLGKSGGTIYNSFTPKCKPGGEAQVFHFPKKEKACASPQDLHLAMTLSSYI